MKRNNAPRSLLAALALAPLVGTAAAAEPAESDPIDVFFLSDTTGSMGGLINSVQSSSEAILESFAARGNVTFGVGEYRDGNAGSFGFRYDLTDMGAGILSTDEVAVASAIDAWSPSGGGDFPEDNLYGLREVAESTPWREGSRRIIFWFGDAPGLDPASDGTTLEATLAALNEYCIEVIAFDLSSLDSTGQATTITDAELDCGAKGGLYANVDEILGDDGILAEEIDSILLDLFETVVSGGSTPAVVASSLRGGSLAVARTMSRDVGARLYRMRSGIRDQAITTTVSSPGPVMSDKGGKGGMAKAPYTETITTIKRWEAWAQVYYVNESQDGTAIPGAARRPDTDVDIIGGTVGVDYDVDQNWNVGIALGAAQSDFDADPIAQTDVDSVALMPYVSYVQEDVYGTADLYADAVLSYGWHDYEVVRPGGVGDTDGNSLQIEINAGLNMEYPYSGGTIIHGPMAQFRYLDGDIDAYTDSGGLAVPSLDYESVATQLGWQASFPTRVEGGILVPQVRVAWEHEFEADADTFAGIAVGGYDDDLLVAGAGLFYYTDNGARIGIDYEARLGSDTDSHYVGITGGFAF